MVSPVLTSALAAEASPTSPPPAGRRTARLALRPAALRLGTVLRRAAVLLLLATPGLGAGPAADPGPAAARGLLLDACRIGPEVFAVGERGSVIRSLDSGRSWTLIHCPAGATLTAISFADTHVAWIVGHDATVLRSADGGASWTIQKTGATIDTSFLDVLALDPNTAVAVGAYGACYVTTDGGHTWSPEKLLEEDLHLNRLTREQDTTFLIAGERGTLLRMAAPRAAPVALSPGYDGSFNGVLSLGSGQLLAYGLRGHVYRSTDDGATWSRSEGLPEALLSTGVQLSSGAIVLAGQARVFAVSFDSGKTFSPWRTPLTTAVARVIEAPDGSVLAFGEAGASRLPAPTVPGEKP